MQTEVHNYFHIRFFQNIVQQLPLVRQRERGKKTGIFFFFLKPHAMMFETLKYLDRHFLVRGISHRWQQQQYIMSKMEEIEAVESVFIGGSENQQSHKSGSSDIIMTRDFFYFCFCRFFFRKIVGSQVYNLNENFAFATNRGRRIFFLHSATLSIQSLLQSCLVV